MADDHDFEKTEATGAGVFPMQCSALRKNGYVVLKGSPCKIMEMSTSKTGKHGHAKVHLVGLDIFTGKKCEDICPSTHNMDVPVVRRTELQLLNVTDEDPAYIHLLNPDGSTREDLKLPAGELGQQIKADFDAGKDLMLTVQAAMNIEAVIAYKEAPK
jgi:translation initiation factor 5A